MHECVVIPAYNEAATIRDVVTRARATCEHVIVVDDGSTDGTTQILSSLPVTVLTHGTNRGKAAALWSGFQYALGAGAAGVITLDGDGQHRPEDIPRLREAARRHPGCIVIGARLVGRDAAPRKRYYANCVANFWISWAAGYRISDSQSGFRYYPAALLRRVRVPHDRAHGFVFESEILIEAARLGVRSVPLAIAAIYAPNARASHFRAVVDVVRITRMVAWELLSRGLSPLGFARAFLWPRAAPMQARAELVADAAGDRVGGGAEYHDYPRKLAGGKER
jgi:glycosyltransferase involved in cell wall biosynthesis